MKVHWTDTALGHLSAIHDYIAQDSALYARAVVDRLTARSQQIGRLPGSGRAVPEYEDPSVREVLEKPYRIIYLINESQVDVLAVIHQAQDLFLNRPRR